MTTERSDLRSHVNGRVTSEQLAYLEQLADELDVPLSAALRRAIDQSRMLDAARTNEKLRRAIASGEEVVDTETGERITLDDVHGADTWLALTPVDPLAGTDDQEQAPA